MRRALALLALIACICTPAVAQEEREQPTAWSLAAAGADGRSLIVVYEAGGCSQDGRVIVSETKREIGIEVRHTVALTGACPANTAPKALVARLDAPVSGRFVTGQNRLGPGPMPGWKVPRVRGLSPPDAARVLGEHGYHIRTRGRRTTGKVALQYPRAGTRLRARRTVTLRFTSARR